MKPFTFLLALACLVPSALANDQIRDVQAALKNQGFYYGEVTGTETAETGAAIRRFQIRNGISVTGKLNAETLAALGLQKPAGKSPATPPAAAEPRQVNPDTPSQKPPPPAVRNEPPPPVKRSPEPVPADDGVTAARRLRPDGATVVDPPLPIPAPVFTPMVTLFRGTPYEDAPREVQLGTVRRAQSILAARRHYRGPIDGVPGPGTSEAVFLYQAEHRLQRTGRLDLETLAEMNLLPSRSPRDPILKPFYNPNRRRDSSLSWDFWVR